MIDAPPPRPVRRAVDALRLAVSAITLVVTVLLAVATASWARQVQHGLLAAAVALPTGLRDLLVAVAQVAAMVSPAVALGVVVVRRRLDAVLRVVPAAAIGGLSAWLLVHLVLAGSRPDSWPGVLGGRGALVRAGWPSSAYLAACAAAVVAGGPWLGHGWRRALWILTVGCAGLTVTAAALVPLDAVAALLAGAAAGSATLLAGGGPVDRPPARAVADALLACGIPVTGLRQLPTAAQRLEEGTVYAADTGDGSRLDVRVLGHEDRSREVLHRLARWVLLRHPADADSPRSPLGAVEHELLMLVAAGRGGARVVEPVIAFPVAGGGALLATVATDGRPLSALTDAELTDQVLAGTWKSVARLQERRVAHRALLPEHLLVEPDSEVRLTAFARAELNAPADQLGADLAELLATTAVRVGPARAVAGALSGLGPDRLATALPYLQPLALLGPIRHAVAAYDLASANRAGGRHRTLRPGGRPSLLRDLAHEITSVTGSAPAQPAHLARFTWKKAVALVAAFAALHLLLPQLANASSAAAALRDANWWWVLAALPAPLLSPAFSSCLQIGTTPGRLPFGPTYQVQFASSFLNRITPNNVGGMAMNLRYLQKTGIETGAATASVGLQTLTSVAANLLVAAVFFAWTGRRHAGLHLSTPAGRYLLPAVTVVLVAGGLFLLTAPGRRFFRDKVWRFLRAAAGTVTTIAADPAKLAVGVVGALGLPVTQIAALALCVHALGGNLPLVQVGAAYMAARLIANTTPVPGGLGALEAGLITGLTALGMAAGPATSAVLVYRLLTFWLNIPLGALALAVVQRRGYV